MEVFMRSSWLQREEHEHIETAAEQRSSWLQRYMQDRSEKNRNRISQLVVSDEHLQFTISKFSCDYL